MASDRPTPFLHGQCWRVEGVHRYRNEGPVEWSYFESLVSTIILLPARREVYSLLSMDLYFNIKKRLFRTCQLSRREYRCPPVRQPDANANRRSEMENQTNTTSKATDGPTTLSFIYHLGKHDKARCIVNAIHCKKCTLVVESLSLRLQCYDIEILCSKKFRELLDPVPV